MNKRLLYEGIMTKVGKVVKKALNEYEVSYDMSGWGDENNWPKYAVVMVTHHPDNEEFVGYVVKRTKNDAVAEAFGYMLAHETLSSMDISSDMDMNIRTRHDLLRYIKEGRAICGERECVMVVPLPSNTAHVKCFDGEYGNVGYYNNVTEKWKSSTPPKFIDDAVRTIINSSSILPIFC